MVPSPFHVRSGGFMSDERTDAREHAVHAHSSSVEESFVKDPVCGMKVNPSSAQYSCEHNGRQYFFRGHRCLTKFQAEPATYLNLFHEHHTPEAHPHRVPQRPTDEKNRHYLK